MTGESPAAPKPSPHTTMDASNALILDYSGSSSISVTITPQDMAQGDETFTRNPLALALARALGMEEVFVLRTSATALEMTPPYRTIYLPIEAVDWLQNYASQLHPIGAEPLPEPFTFEVEMRVSTRKITIENSDKK